MNTLGLSTDDITETTCGDIKWMDDMPAHENGAIDFAIRIFEILTTEYGFPFWLLNEDTLKQMLGEALEEWYRELAGKVA